MADDAPYGGMGSPYHVTVTRKAGDNSQPLSVMSPRMVSMGGGRSSLANLGGMQQLSPTAPPPRQGYFGGGWPVPMMTAGMTFSDRSEEHTSELQSLRHLVC